MSIEQRLEVWHRRQSAVLAGYSPVVLYGRVQRVSGMLLQCRLPQARIGDLYEVETSDQAWILAEIIGFDQQDAMLSALGNLQGIRAGAAVKRLGGAHRLRVGDDLLGQVLDGFGRSLHDSGAGAFARSTSDAGHTVMCDGPLPTDRPAAHKSCIAHRGAGYRWRDHAG